MNFALSPPRDFAKWFLDLPEFTGSTFAAYAASGYFVYYQHGVGQNPIRIPFDQDVVFGYLASDNVLCWKVAEYLNNTGLYIHIEITFSQMVFKYVQ